MARADVAQRRSGLRTLLLEPGALGVGVGDRGRAQDHVRLLGAGALARPEVLPVDAGGLAGVRAAEVPGVGEPGAEQRRGLLGLTCRSALALGCGLGLGPVLPRQWRRCHGFRGQLDIAEQQLTGVTPGLVRLSVGIETLDDILAAPAVCDLARDIQNRMRRARDQLLTFVAFPGRVEATNNACERDLRPAVVQRKNTNGYRAMWSAKGEAAVRTVVLLTPEEVDAAAQRSVEYRPPGS